ncbi:MAG: hypothetical protein JKY50_04965 [Oleispira sp.]|nr:hypothetical protein [Oleispira sp.]
MTKYIIESLPPALGFDESRYVPNASIEFVDGFLPVREIVSSSLEIPFTAAISETTGAISFSVRMPKPQSADRIFYQGGSSERSVRLGLGWGELTPLLRQSAIHHEVAIIQMQQSKSIGWGQLTSIDKARSVLIESASIEVDSNWLIIVSDGLKAHTNNLNACHFGVDYYGIRASEYDLRQLDLYTNVSANIEFGDAVDSGFYIPSPVIEWGNYQLEKQAAIPFTSGINAGAYQPPAKNSNSHLPWGEGIALHYSPELPYFVEPEVVVPGEVPDANKQEVYIIVNNVNVKALPGNEPLAFADIKIDLDEDSCSWKISAAVLNQQSVELVKPNESGFKEIEVSINGHVWIFFINTWQRSRSVIGNTLDKKYQVSGYSRTQYLGEPYAPKRTKSIGSTTAVQAAGEELVGTGFTLDWNVTDLPDWSMPASVFSYQELTPLQVIKRLASTVGALVLPSMVSDRLTVIPKDRIAPWELATATIDRTIHENQILTDGGTRQPRQKLNSVRVSGEHQGVDMNITRQGTAGDSPGSDVVDAWISAAEANTSRGRAEIADSGDIETYTMELAIPETASQPGLLLPGLYVAVQHKNSVNDYRAKVTAISISVPGRGLVKVRQNIVLQRPVAWEVVV